MVWLMDNIRNIFSTILMMIGTTMSFLDQIEQWSRIIAAMITIIVGLVTLYRFLKAKK